MTLPLHSRAKSLFLELETLPLAAREERLAACQDPELEAAVRGLLAALDGPDDLFDGAAPLPSAAAGPSDQPDRTGSRIGAYRLDHLLGRGGMGEVWSAQRADGEFQKRVAIKLLTASAMHSDGLSRFQVEREVLANLSHRGIADLYDGGVSEDGVPYFVMEHVDGQPIDEYCDAQRLGVNERLELFQQICEALGHAHASGIVHRDIKPPNVLVNGAGEVKLLDFGIAKVLERPQGIASFETATGQTPMTPAYASPEQLRAKPITPASDVYSLGVLLYELLTGSLPYDADPDSQLALALAICEQPIQRPSSRFATTPARLGVTEARGNSAQGIQRRLRGDLDLIVLMTLRKEPERRYPDAQALAADIQRHLRRYPILARRDSALYRATRFMSRHRGAARVAAAGLLASAGLGLVASWLAAENSAQSQAIAADQGHLSALHTTLLELYEEADPWSPGTKQATRRSLDLATRPLHEETIASPEVHAKLHYAAGRAYSKLELYPEAQGLLEVAVESLRGLGDGSKAELAASLFELGNSLVANPKANGARGLELLREALELERELHGDDHHRVGRVRYAIGAALHDARGQGNPQEQFTEAIRIFRLQEGGASKDLARALQRQGDLLAVFQSDLQAAVDSYLEALGHWKQLYGDDHPAYASCADGLGLLLYKTGEKDAGIDYLSQALSINRRVFGAEGHSVLAWTLLNLGGAKVHAQDPSGEPLLVEAIAMLRTLPSQSPGSLSFALDSLGKARLALGLPGASEPYAEALEMGLASGASVRSLARKRSKLVDALVADGKLTQAIELQEETVSAWAQQEGQDSEQATQARTRLSELQALGR